MKRRLKASARRGSILVLSAFMMVFLVGFVALAVDTGMIALARTQLQCAADAGALAAADALGGDMTAAQTAAQTFAQDNVAGGAAVSVTPASDIVFGTWSNSSLTFTPLTGTAISGANAVQVTCRLANSRGDALQLFFAPLFGLKHVDVSATAIATKSSYVCGPFVGINSVTMSGGSYTDSYNSNNGSYTVGSAHNNGDVCSNGPIVMSGTPTTVNGDAHPGPGSTVTMTGGAKVTGSTTPLTQALR